MTNWILNNCLTLPIAPRKQEQEQGRREGKKMQYILESSSCCLFSSSSCFFSTLQNKKGMGEIFFSYWFISGCPMQCTTEFRLLNSPNIYISRISLCLSLFLSIAFSLMISYYVYCVFKCQNSFTVLFFLPPLPMPFRNKNKNWIFKCQFKCRCLIFFFFLCILHTYTWSCC